MSVSKDSSRVRAGASNAPVALNDTAHGGISQSIAPGQMIRCESRQYVQESASDALAQSAHMIIETMAVDTPLSRATSRMPFAAHTLSQRIDVFVSPS
jgi:hypothetical protein